jgi:hypothetical protein
MDTNKTPEHVTDVLAHESHLKGSEGLFILRTRNNQIIPVGGVCASAKDGGRFTGNVDEMIGHVNIFFREVVRLLRDGYGINLAGLLELILNIGGCIETPDAPLDPKKNPVSIRTRLLHGAAKAAQGISVRNWGLAAAARIDTITDSKTGAVNDVVTAGGPFTMEGPKIKIAGTGEGPQDKLGVAFRSTDTPGLMIWVTENLILNEKSKIIGITPDLPPGKDWYAKVFTRYTSSGFLKETREITSGFIVRSV